MPRVRFRQPDEIPSPYLQGVFDSYGEVSAAIIESNRGCPFGCTFCDWGSATQQKVRKFDVQRVRDEITWLAQRKVRILEVLRSLQLISNDRQALMSRQPPGGTSQLAADFYVGIGSSQTSETSCDQV